MTEVPFGFDDAIERVNLEDGEYEFIVGTKTTARVSQKGNSTLTVSAVAVGYEETTWPLRMHLPLAGKSAGMTKKFLKSVGIDPDDFIENLLSMYEGSSDPKEVANFWKIVAVPQLIGLHFGGRVVSEIAMQDGEVVLSRETGEPMTNYNIKSHWPL